MPIQEEAVNLRGTREALSSPLARPKEPTREVRQDLLMEQVVNREHILMALHRVERNKGAAGVDGIESKSLRPRTSADYD